MQGSGSRCAAQCQSRFFGNTRVKLASTTHLQEAKQVCMFLRQGRYLERPLGAACWRYSYLEHVNRHQHRNAPQRSELPATARFWTPVTD
jgi:hypothetical protein